MHSKALFVAVGLLANVAPLRVSGLERMQIPIEDLGAGTYYAEGSVAGSATARFLIDTGSGYTGINAAMLSALQSEGTATYVKDLIGVMADGSERIVGVYLVPHVRLGSCVIRNVEVAVLPGEDTRPILGMKLLRKMSPFTLSTDPPVLSVSGCESLSNARPSDRRTSSEPSQRNGRTSTPP